MQFSTFYDHVLDIARQGEMETAEAMSLVREMGIELLEFSTVNLLGHEAEIKSLLDKSGLAAASVCAYFDFGWEPDLTPGREMLERASFLGAAHMLAIPGFYGSEDGELVRDRQRKNMIAAVTELSVISKEYGIDLLMEDYDNELAPFSTTAGLLEFLEAAPQLGCAFDTGNFMYSEEDELEAFEQLQHRIAYVHLKDRSLVEPPEGGRKKTTVKNRDLYPCPVGQGVIKISEILLRLKDYDGIYTIEHYGSERCEEYLRLSLEWLGAAFDSRI